jgi:hypothetical protein
MSDNSINTSDLQAALADPKFITTHSFEILQSLCCLSGIKDQEEAQDMLLRALEVREHFTCGQEILEGLTRKFGLFPYLTPETLSVADKIAYEVHRPENMDPDWLFAAALPRESRVERLIRWQVERRALGRSALLCLRVEALKARGGRGRRAAAVERVGQAARLMLAGDDVDTAAKRAGFRASGRTSAANRLARSMRAVGLGIVGGPAGQRQTRSQA